MSRIKRHQNISSLIKYVSAIAENRCSLSVEDLEILNEALTRLKGIKEKKGSTNEDVLSETVLVVELLTKYLLTAPPNDEAD